MTAADYIRAEIATGNLPFDSLPPSIALMADSANVLEPSADTWASLTDREAEIVAAAVAGWQRAHGLLDDGKPGPVTRSAFAWSASPEEIVTAYVRVLVARNPKTEPENIREAVEELIAQCEYSGLDIAAMADILFGLAETESHFDRAAGWERGGNGAVGVWQMKPDYAAQWLDAGWKDATRDEIRHELRDNVRHATRAFARWMSHRWERGAKIARETPAHKTFRARAWAYQSDWKSKGGHWGDARPVAIPTPRKNAWLAHYNRGSSGVGRYPDFDAPNRPDGSAYQLKTERNGAEIRKALGAE